MFIGASININSFRFVLIDADEYALRYMECHCNEVSVFASFLNRFYHFVMVTVSESEY